MHDSLYAGTLFICPTPIGNMQDITFRVLTCLEQVDLIACEDTRRTQKLLNHYNIENRLISYHKFNQEKRGAELIAQLNDGKNIALVADSGTPTISDPGQYLVQAAIESGIPVYPLPGPSAAVTALTASGLNTDAFLFLGFIPEKGKARKEKLLRIARSEETVILYENANRLFSTLEELAPLLGDRHVVVARELTKAHEEFLRGKVETILQKLQEKGKLKGEITLMIAGHAIERAEDLFASWSVKAHLNQLIDEGFSKKDAIKLVSELRGIAKNKVYQTALELEKQKR